MALGFKRLAIWATMAALGMALAVGDARGGNITRSVSRGVQAQGAPRGESDRAAVLRSCFDFGAWLTMDHDALAARVGDAVRKHPQDPATMVLLMLYREAIEESSTPDVVGEAVRDLIRAAKGDVARALGVNARPLLEHLHEVAVRRGWWDDVLMCQHCWFGLQSWLLAGPFAAWGEGDMVDVPLGPDVLCSLTQPMSGGLGPVSWKSWQPETPLDLEVSPSEVSKLGGGGWFMLTEVHNPGPTRRVLLDVYAGTGGMKVWLDGSMVMRRLQARDLSRDDVALVDLPSGTSTLLLKFGQEATVTVRICDPITRLTLPDITSKIPTAETFKAFGPTGTVSPLAERWSPAFQPLARRFDELIGDGDERAMLAAALALVASDSNAPELAEDCWKASEKWRLADPIRDATLGAMYFDRNTVHAPEAERRELRARLETLVAASPSNVRPRLELAEMLGEDDQDAAAAKLLNDAIATRPHWSVHLAAAEFYERKGWQAEARDHRLRAFAEPKPTPPVLRDHAEMLQDDLDEPGAARTLDAMLAIWPGSNTAVWRRFNLALRRSEFELAERLIAVEVKRIGGDSQNVLSSRARLALAKGDWRAAKAIHDSLAVMPYRNAEVYAESAADITHRYGTPEEASEAWRRLLALKPSSDVAQQALASLNGIPAHPWPTQFTPVSHQLLDLATPADFPKAGHAVMLDEQVWEVRTDGSAIKHGQRLVKVLRQESVDRIGRDWVSGEVVRARTMLADGTYAEPASVTGSSFEFPRVAPGAAIDTAWTTTSFSGDGVSFGGHEFAFRESDSAIPTLKSRLVVIMPASVRHSVSLKGKGSEHVVYTTKSLDDGRIEMSWELAQPTSQSYEPSMPSMRELTPVVEFAKVDGTITMAAVARGMIASIGDPEVTWLVREKTDEVLAELRERIERDSIFDRENSMPKDSYVEEAGLLYRWVNQNIKGSGGGHHPHSTLEELAGDREALFIAMLEAAKIPYRLLRVGGNPLLREVSGIAAPPMHRRLVLVWGYVPMRQGVERGMWPRSTRVTIDFGNRMAPFGALGRGVAGATGVAIDPATLTWEPYTIGAGDGLLHGSTLTATIQLPASEDDDATITGRLDMSGDAGWQRREDAENTSASRHRLNLEATLSDSLVGVSLDTVETDKEYTPGTRAPFWQSFAGTLSGSIRAEGESLRVAIPLERVSSMFAGTTSLPHRSFDLMLTSTQDEQARITLTAPQGYAWTAPPRDLAVTSGPLSCTISFALEGNSLTISRSLSLRPWRVPAGEYAGFRALIDGIDAVESTSLTLVKISD